MVEKDKKKEKITGAEKKQFGPFKKRRAGIVLTKDEVEKIKKGRKELRAKMRSMGIKSKKEFELTASSLGLYFDKNRRFAILIWLFSGKGLWALLVSGILALAVLSAFSAISSMRGHFTISMSDDMFREGFTISETKGFENPTSHLFSTPAEDVPCISINSIPKNVDQIDGAHHERYFAYTFYVRNEGENAQNMSWQLRLDAESKNLSKATWMMVFVDGKMNIFAEANEDGTPQTLPAQDDNTRGYLNPPLYDFAQNPDQQYEIIKQSGAVTYWRVKPKPFLSDLLVEHNLIENFKPGEIHKYTVVIWLEGDDPQCTDELKNGHLGMSLYMQLEK